jgi:hypothetical protein
LDLADQLERLVATIDAHPGVSLVAGLFIILFVCVRKDGLFSKYLSYLEEKARLESALETRRLEAMRMLEERAQMSLPGVIREEEKDTK